MFSFHSLFPIYNVRIVLEHLTKDEQHFNCALCYCDFFFIVGEYFKSTNSQFMNFFSIPLFKSGLSSGVFFFLIFCRINRAVLNSNYFLTFILKHQML